MKIIKTMLVVLIVMAVVISTSSQNVGVFKKNDKVVFVGNSITDGGHYHSYIWLYYMTHFPKTKLEIVNAGVGGDTSFDILRRLDADVLNLNPTVVTLTFGMNDTGYQEFNGKNIDAFITERVSRSDSSFKLIEKKLLSYPHIRKIMIGGSPYDETAKVKNHALKRKNGAIQQLIEIQKKVAEKNNWEFVDFNNPMLKINAIQQQKDSGFSFCPNDRIHPENDGHLVMAYLFLKSQGLAGKPVAGICIDAVNKKVVTSENCKIQRLKSENGSLSFNYLANSLPYPLDTVARGWEAKQAQAKGIKYIPFMEEINRETLQVSGLDGKYRISIDGEVIGEFSSSELLKGINLASISKTPQYQQAIQVMYLNEERFEIERRLRQYAWTQFSFFQNKDLLFADDRKAIDAIHAGLSSNFFLAVNMDNYTKSMFPEIRNAWKKEMSDLVDVIYSINTPKNRKIVIVKI